DVDALTRFASTAILQLFGNALMLIGVLIVSTIIDWRAGLLIALSAGVAVCLLVHFRRVATPYYDDEREVQGQLYGDLEERLDGLEDLRANGAGRWAVQRLQEHSARWGSAGRRGGFRRGWASALRGACFRGGGARAAASLTFTAGSVLMLGLGVYLNRQGEMTVGTVLTLFRFSQQVSDPLWQVAEQLSEFQKAAAGTRPAARLAATEA